MKKDILIKCALSPEFLQHAGEVANKKLNALYNFSDPPKSGSFLEHVLKAKRIKLIGQRDKFYNAALKMIKKK